MVDSFPKNVDFVLGLFDSPFVLDAQKTGKSFVCSKIFCIFATEMHITGYKEKDLLKAHGLMMSQLVRNAGHYRQEGVGVFDGNGNCLHMAPPPVRVQELMGDLHDKLHDKFPELSERAIAVLEVARAHRGFNAAEIGRQIGLSERQVKTHITKLKQVGLIVRVGSNKTGYWNVNI